MVWKKESKNQLNHQPKERSVAADPARVAGDVSTRLTLPGATQPSRATPGRGRSAERCSEGTVEAARGAAADGVVAGNVAECTAGCTVNAEDAAHGAAGGSKRDERRRKEADCAARWGRCQH